MTRVEIATGGPTETHTANVEPQSFAGLGSRCCRGAGNAGEALTV
jgi:hypothetical protein